MTTQFITLTRMSPHGAENDTSSLQVHADRLQVIGNLEHCAGIKPHTAKDARALIDWLVTDYLTGFNPDAGRARAEKVLDVLDSLRAVGPRIDADLSS
jgi:hypothetical protein